MLLVVNGIGTGVVKGLVVTTAVSERGIAIVDVVLNTGTATVVGI